MISDRFNGQTAQDGQPVLHVEIYEARYGWQWSIVTASGAISNGTYYRTQDKALKALETSLGGK